MAKTLILDNIYANASNGKEILHGISLILKKGEVHVIMGPNGSGKSTLAHVIAGHPWYTVTNGSMKINTKNITALSPDQKAKQGIFLGLQYPIEVAGVSFTHFLRLALNERKNNREKKISPVAFRNILTQQAKLLRLKEDITTRMLNEGFSGGEKKKAEILQLMMLKPDFAILDEPDSGLDVDSLKYIADGINSVKEHMGILLITHYQRLLKFITPDFVHIMIEGKIVITGNGTLVKDVEKDGYEKFLYC